MHSRERSLSALYAIDPGCDRDTWVKVGMAAMAAGLTLDDFTEWSTPAPNFGGDRDCATVWKSFDTGAVKAGTLFYQAKISGWSDPGKPRMNGHERHGEPKRAKSAGSSSPRTSPADAVMDRWDECYPATGEHPYIIAKRGTPDGLRVVPADSSWSIAGKNVAGWLAVPVITLDGELCTLQLVPSPGGGEKLNAPGAALEDGLFTVGDAEAANRLYVAEGIGQAWACARATGCAAIVTFGAGRMAHVATLLRQRFPSKRIVLMPDRGKEGQAVAIARRVAAGWVEMPKEKPANYDANDYAADYGQEALAHLLATPRMPQLRYRLLDGRALLTVPPLPWMVRGMLPHQGLASVYGASGSGKSFLVLDLGVAIAGGVDWFGCRAQQAPVVYVALEGEAGFSQRVKAWRTKYGRDLPPDLHFVMQPFDLRNEQDLTDLAEAVKASGCAGGLLIIDTLNRAASGADENSSSDMGDIITAAKALQARFGGLVLLVHHSGKDQSKGLRGHSSLHAALDSAVEVIRSDNRRSWRIAKSKDDCDSIEHPFRLEVVPLGAHDDGEPITSCVVVPDGGRNEVQRAIPPKGGNQRVALQAITDLSRRLAGTQRHQRAPLEAPPSANPVSTDAVLDAIRDRLVCDDKRKTERARQALTGLQGRGAVVVKGGFVWLA